MADETKSDLTSTTEDASNTALDVVTDLALDTAIPAPIRRNALKAFDRLCSALINVPVGALERRSAEKRAESEARIKIREEITAQIVQQIQINPEYALKAGHKFAEKIIREQLNLDKISGIAANELQTTELTSSTNQGTNQTNGAQSADLTNQDTNGGEEKIINDDWLNNFETQARQVSTEDMQLRFGRVLASEIEKPGSYSTKTVKILSELNRSAAVLFRRMCSMCVGFRDRPEPFRTVILPTACTDGRKGWQYSMDVWQLNILIEHGLIVSRQEIWDPQYYFSIENENKNCQPFWYQGKYWGLRRLSGSEEKNASMEVRGIPLSQTGTELFHVVEQEPMDSITEDFSKRHVEVLQKFFAEHNLQMVKVQLQQKVFAEGKAVLYSVKWL